MTRPWTSRLALAGALILAGAAGALAGSSATHTVTVKNGSNYTVLMEAFNNNDRSRSIAASQANLAPGAQGQVTCNTSGSCYLTAEYDASSGMRTQNLIGLTSTCIELQPGQTSISWRSC